MFGEVLAYCNIVLLRLWFRFAACYWSIVMISLIMTFQFAIEQNL